MVDVASAANPRIKHLVSLRKRSVRDAEGVTLVDGYDEVALAVTAGARVESLFWCPDLVAEERRGLVDRLAGHGVEVVTVSRSAFARASYRQSPDGWLAVVARPDRPLASLDLRPQPLVLVAESVEKPGNLGAMLRTADAAGADAVVAASAVTDWGNPNVVRASKGAVFAVPVASAATEEVAGWLHSRGLRVVVATPDATTVHTEADLTGPLAIVVGAEHAGVTSHWLDRGVVAVRIPMAGRVNSLNVATSAALVLYEAVRQR